VAIVVKAQRMTVLALFHLITNKQRNAQNIQQGLAKPGYISYDTLRRHHGRFTSCASCITVLKEKVSKTKWVVRPKDPLADKAPFKEQIGSGISTA